MSHNKELQSFETALQDHSAEGIAILSSEPSRLTFLMIYLIMSLLLAGFIWSFFGRADVIVTAVGTLEPESSVENIYGPIDGELVEIYIAEGMPVAKGDVVARINARRAIQAATEALDAQLKLQEVEREYELFPARKKLMKRQLDALQTKIEIEEKLYKNRLSDGLDKLAETQKLKLEKARARLEEAKIAQQVAERELAKFRRLSRLQGGGGISQQQIEEKKNAYLAAKTAYQLAEAELGEHELQLTREYLQENTELQISYQKLIELRIQYESEKENIKNIENQLQLKLRAARLAAETASRVSFENIDEDNFLRILAPHSGVVTRVYATQPGDKIDPSRPLADIAPVAVRPILNIEIAEQDRAFLQEGLPVKLKFNAFPYQRYGFINGTLEYISPATIVFPESKKTAYQGHVSLDQDYFSVADINYPIRYGMTATAEIVIRKRRLIDIALDPLRKLQG